MISPPPPPPPLAEGNGGFASTLATTLVTNCYRRWVGVHVIVPSFTARLIEQIPDDRTMVEIRGPSAPVADFVDRPFPLECQPLTPSSAEAVARVIGGDNADVHQIFAEVLDPRWLALQKEVNLVASQLELVQTLPRVGHAIECGHRLQSSGKDSQS